MLKVFAVVSQVLRKQPEDAFDYEEKQWYCSICTSRIVLNTFFEVFSWCLPQICNILARTVLVREVAYKRFQKDL